MQKPANPHPHSQEMKMRINRIICKYLLDSARGFDINLLVHFRTKAAFDQIHY